jgi:hypothetical protein
LTFAFAAPVLAAAPGNDTYGGRTTIGSLLFSDSVDTTEATTDADDAEANADCGAPATDASVWYEFAGNDTAILVDVSGSDYSAGVIIATGSPGSLVAIACGPGGSAFFAESGTTYAILAFDDQLDGAGNGGNLSIVVDVLPPPPTVDVTVDPIGHFNANSGAATITGTVTCDSGAFAFIDLSVRQRVGRFVISGFGGAAVECDGTQQAWSAEVQPDNGVFKGGKAKVDAFAQACNDFDCGFDEEQTAIALRR